jgi:hypothetical protein
MSTVSSFAVFLEGLMPKRRRTHKAGTTVRWLEIPVSGKSRDRAGDRKLTMFGKRGGYRGEETRASRDGRGCIFHIHTSAFDGPYLICVYDDVGACRIAMKLQLPVNCRHLRGSAKTGHKLRMRVVSVATIVAWYIVIAH